MRQATALLVCLAAIFCAARYATAFEHFVTRQGDQLMDGDRPLRFVSWNIPNLLVLEDAFEFLGESPFRWPNEFEVTDALRSVRQMGGTVVRTYVITVRREGSQMGDLVHVTGPGEFNEEAFRTLDMVLKVSNETGVRVIIPLVDNWKWQGGVGEYAAFRGNPAEAFWTDPQLIADFKRTIRYVLTRRNTLTGQLYRDEPAVFGWETGNELDAPPEWTAKIAAYIKKLDPNHLVIDGRSLHGIPVESLDDPNVDVLTTHHYPNQGNNAETIRRAAELARGRKPYFVGEFGFVDIDEARRMFDAVIDEGVAGALYWSLRYHRREGGFYWHHEPAGGDLFKAYHWPGFPSGREYREHLVLPMVRDAAYRIRSETPPPVEPPAPPVLLPIDTPGRISWQGSAGATAYDVQRSTPNAQAWEAIATNVSDAAVQYRPLFCDTTAEPGKAYLYRVVAKNAAGASAPSNVVGPVTATHRTLVDELRDMSLAVESSGPIRFRSNEARKVQEDIHRQQLGAGANVTYCVEAPISRVLVYAFAERGDAPLHLATSDDGVEFTPLTADRRVRDNGKNDYGYLSPILLEARPNGARCLRVSTPVGGEPVQLSRVEIEYGG